MSLYPSISSSLAIAMQGQRSVTMNADAYLYSILAREKVDTGLTSAAMQVFNRLEPIIAKWAGSQLTLMFPSGSFAKGTGNRSGTDIDIFISLKSDTTQTLKEIYGMLADHMKSLGYTATKQNVSINIRVNGIDVDLVPGKRQDTTTSYHSLYRRKADTWQQTNVVKHVNHVKAANRISETRILKLWRKQKRLEFPSFYLELTVIDALRGTSGNLSDQVRKCLVYLRDRFENARVVDPANTNNIISDDLTASEKKAVAGAAGRALNANWSDLVA